MSATPGRAGYRHSATARAVLTSLVPVVCPPAAVPLAAAIVDHMELTFSTTPVVLQVALPVAFAMYDVGSLLRYRRRARALVGDRAEAYFASWEHGLTPVHVQFARAINQLMSLSCYEQAPMMERVGYRVAPWIAEVTKKRLTLFADDIAAQQRQLLAPDPLRPHAVRTAKKEVA